MKKRFYQISSTLLCLFIVTTAQASTVAQYPWATTLKTIFDSIDGPVAYFLSGIAIVLAGLTMAFMDLQGGGKKFVQAAMGISIAFGAVQIIGLMFTFSGAVVF